MAHLMLRGGASNKETIAKQGSLTNERKTNLSCTVDRADSSTSTVSLWKIDTSKGVGSIARINFSKDEAST